MEFESETCRVCLQTSIEYIPLAMNFEEYSLTYLEAFNICTNLNAKLEDIMPKYLCTDCIKKLEVAYQFRKQAGKSEIEYQNCVYTLVDKVASNDLNESDGDFREQVLELESNSSEILSESEIEPYSEEYYKTDSELNQIISMTQIEVLSGSQNTEYSSYVEEYESSIESYGQRKQMQESNNCVICNKKFITATSLRFHIAEHTETINLVQDEKKSSYTCYICGNEYSTSIQLSNHKQTHKSNKKFQCEICNKRFRTKTQLTNHILVHTGEKPFNCQYCGKAFASKTTLQSHERIHTGERPYECRLCGRRFTQVSVLTTHMFLHTGKTVKCSKCDKKFSRPSNLLLHEREHTGERPYACDKCPSRFKQKSCLMEHMSFHDGTRFKCPNCDKEFSRKCTLTQHMVTHSTSFPFHCTYCTQKFITKEKLANHLQRIHKKIVHLNTLVPIDTLDED